LYDRISDTGTIPMKHRNITTVSLAVLLVTSLILATNPADSLRWIDSPSRTTDGPEPNAGTTGYHTYDEMVTELFQIAANHPVVTDLTSIGTTYEGRDIWCMKISDNAHTEEDEPEVIIYGMHHSREWGSAEVPLYIIQFLTGNYSTNTSVQTIVDEREIWIIPIVNPDGRVFDGEDDPAVYTNWRKNRVPNWDGSRGVDLNRNYDWMWGGAGADDDPSGGTYRGSAPFSENETQAIRDFALQHDFVFSLSYHSYGQIILYPWGNTYNPSPDDALFSALGWGMSNRMTNKAGSPRDQYIPMRGSQLYLTSGDDVDWMYGELGVLPFVVELYPAYTDSSPAVTPPYNGFHPREDKRIPICEDNLGGALFLLEVADNPHQVLPHVSLMAAPEKRTIDRGQNLSFQIEVINDGSQNDTFDLFAFGPMGWNISLSENVVALASGDSQVVDLWVEVPGVSSSGDIGIDVSAFSLSSSASTSVTVHVPYENDVGVAGITPFQEDGLYPMGNYSIGAEVMNHAPNQQDPFDVLFEVWEIGPPEEINVFFEGFESGMSRWTIEDYDGITSSDNWHVVDWNPHVGMNAVWIGNDVTVTYSDITLQMLVSPSFDLSDALGANLSFYHTLMTELNYDYAVVDIGVGDDWETVQSWSGWQSMLYTQVAFDLSDYIGNDDVRFRFRFSSDEGKVDLGWYIDDIRLNVTVLSETLIHGPVLEPTASQLSQGESEQVSTRFKFKRGGHFKVMASTLLMTDEFFGNNSAKVSFFIDPTRYRIFLAAGMNLVSYPMMTADSSSSAILSTIQSPHDKLWKNEGGPQSWSSYSNTKPWAQDIRLNYTEGWWISVSADTYFDVTGAMPGNVTIFLKTGWNLVGYPTLTDRTVDDTLSGIPYDRVECFDPLAPYHLRPMNDGDYMTTGMGYWVHATQDATLVVNP
jgi:carboxypeptidase T